MLAGVAGGLGRYFNVDPVIVRIAFAVSLFLGGLGALAYVALALFVPTGDADGSEVDGRRSSVARRSRSRRGRHPHRRALVGDLRRRLLARVLHLAASPPARRGRRYLVAASAARRRARASGRPWTASRIALAVIVAMLAIGRAATLAVASAWAGATGHGVAVAAVLTGVGVLLIVSAFSGGARWLLLPAPPWRCRWPPSQPPTSLRRRRRRARVLAASRSRRSRPTAMTSASAASSSTSAISSGGRRQSSTSTSTSASARRVVASRRMSASPASSRRAVARRPRGRRDRTGSTRARRRRPRGQPAAARPQRRGRLRPVPGDQR